MVELVDTRRSERRASRGRGSSTLPLATSRGAGWAGARPTLIRPEMPGSIPGPATVTPSPKGRDNTSGWASAQRGLMSLARRGQHP